MLAADPLTVAELTRITRLPQPRISTHLKKLKEAGLVLNRRSGGSTFYSRQQPPEPVAALLKASLDGLSDPLLAEDRKRARQVVLARAGGGWVDRVAGDMARHYSPGRTWESLARGFAGLGRLGRVLDVACGDGSLAGLIAHRCDQLSCLDINEGVLDKARQSLGRFEQVRFVTGDMHDLPFPETIQDCTH